jgi:hypothetical protein
MAFLGAQETNFLHPRPATVAVLERTFFGLMQKGEKMLAGE